MPAKAVVAQNLVSLDPEDREEILSEMADGLSVPEILGVITALKLAALKRGSAPLGNFARHGAEPQPSLPIGTAPAEPEPEFPAFHYNLPRV